MKNIITKKFTKINILYIAILCIIHISTQFYINCRQRGRYQRNTRAGNHITKSKCEEEKPYLITKEGKEITEEETKKAMELWNIKKGEFFEQSYMNEQLINKINANNLQEVIDKVLELGEKVKDYSKNIIKVDIYKSVFESNKGYDMPSNETENLKISLITNNNVVGAAVKELEKNNETILLQKFNSTLGKLFFYEYDEDIKLCKETTSILDDIKVKMETLHKTVTTIETEINEIDNLAKTISNKTPAIKDINNEQERKTYMKNISNLMNKLAKKYEDIQNLLGQQFKTTNKKEILFQTPDLNEIRETKEKCKNLIESKYFKKNSTVINKEDIKRTLNENLNKLLDEYVKNLSKCRKIFTYDNKFFENLTNVLMSKLTIENNEPGTLDNYKGILISEKDLKNNKNQVINTFIQKYKTLDNTIKKKEEDRQQKENLKKKIRELKESKKLLENEYKKTVNKIIKKHNSIIENSDKLQEMRNNLRVLISKYENQLNNKNGYQTNALKKIEKLVEKIGEFKTGVVVVEDETQKDINEKIKKQIKEKQKKLEEITKKINAGKENKYIQNVLNTEYGKINGEITALDGSIKRIDVKTYISRKFENIFEKDFQKKFFQTDNETNEITVFKEKVKNAVEGIIKCHIKLSNLIRDKDIEENKNDFNTLENIISQIEEHNNKCTEIECEDGKIDTDFINVENEIVNKNFKNYTNEIFGKEIIRKNKQNKENSKSKVKKEELNEYEKIAEIIINNQQKDGIKDKTENTIKSYTIKELKEIERKKEKENKSKSKKSKPADKYEPDFYSIEKGITVNIHKISCKFFEYANIIKNSNIKFLKIKDEELENEYNENLAKQPIENLLYKSNELDEEIKKKEDEYVKRMLGISNKIVTNNKEIDSNNEKIKKIEKEIINNNDGNCIRGKFKVMVNKPEYEVLDEEIDKMIKETLDKIEENKDKITETDSFLKNAKKTHKEIRDEIKSYKDSLEKTKENLDNLFEIQKNNKETEIYKILKEYKACYEELENFNKSYYSLSNDNINVAIATIEPFIEEYEAKKYHLKKIRTNMINLNRKIKKCISLQNEIGTKENNIMIINALTKKAETTSNHINKIDNSNELCKGLIKGYNDATKKDNKLLKKNLEECLNSVDVKIGNLNIGAYEKNMKEYIKGIQNYKEKINEVIKQSTPITIETSRLLDLLEKMKSNYMKELDDQYLQSLNKNVLENGNKIIHDQKDNIDGLNESITTEKNKCEKYQESTKNISGILNNIIDFCRKEEIKDKYDYLYNIKNNTEYFVKLINEKVEEAKKVNNGHNDNVNHYKVIKTNIGDISTFFNGRFEEAKNIYANNSNDIYNKIEKYKNLINNLKYYVDERIWKDYNKEDRWIRIIKKKGPYAYIKWNLVIRDYYKSLKILLKIKNKEEKINNLLKNLEVQIKSSIEQKDGKEPVEEENKYIKQLIKKYKKNNKLFDEYKKICEKYITKLSNYDSKYNILRGTIKAIKEDVEKVFKKILDEGEYNGESLEKRVKTLYESKENYTKIVSKINEELQNNQLQNNLLNNDQQKRKLIELIKKIDYFIVNNLGQYNKVYYDFLKKFNEPIDKNNKEIMSNAYQSLVEYNVMNMYKSVGYSELLNTLKKMEQINFFRKQNEDLNDDDIRVKINPGVRYPKDIIKEITKVENIFNLLNFNHQDSNISNFTVSNLTNNTYDKINKIFAKLFELCKKDYNDSISEELVNIKDVYGKYKVINLDILGSYPNLFNNFEKKYNEIIIKYQEVASYLEMYKTTVTKLFYDVTGDKSKLTDGSKINLNGETDNIVYYIENDKSLQIDFNKTAEAKAKEAIAKEDIAKENNNKTETALDFIKKFYENTQFLLNAKTSIKNQIEAKNHYNEYKQEDKVYLDPDQNYIFDIDDIKTTIKNLSDNDNIKNFLKDTNGKYLEILNNKQLVSAANKLTNYKLRIYVCNKIIFEFIENLKKIQEKYKAFMGNYRFIKESFFDNNINPLKAKLEYFKDIMSIKNEINNCINTIGRILGTTLKYQVNEGELIESDKQNYDNIKNKIKELQNNNDTPDENTIKHYKKEIVDYYIQENLKKYITPNDKNGFIISALNEPNNYETFSNNIKRSVKAHKIVEKIKECISGNGILASIANSDLDKKTIKNINVQDSLIDAQINQYIDEDTIIARSKNRFRNLYYMEVETNIIKNFVYNNINIEDEHLGNDNEISKLNNLCRKYGLGNIQEFRYNNIVVAGKIDANKLNEVENTLNVVFGGNEEYSEVDFKIISEFIKQNRGNRANKAERERIKGIYNKNYDYYKILFTKKLDSNDQEFNLNKMKNIFDRFKFYFPKTYKEATEPSDKYKGDNAKTYDVLRNLLNKSINSYGDVSRALGRCNIRLIARNEARKLI